MWKWRMALRMIMKIMILDLWFVWYFYLQKCFPRKAEYQQTLNGSFLYCGYSRTFYKAANFYCAKPLQEKKQYLYFNLLMTDTVDAYCSGDTTFSHPCTVVKGWRASGQFLAQVGKLANKYVLELYTGVTGSIKTQVLCSLIDKWLKSAYVLKVRQGCK